MIEEEKRREEMRREEKRGEEKRREERRREERRGEEKRGEDVVKIGQILDKINTNWSYLFTNLFCLN